MRIDCAVDIGTRSENQDRFLVLSTSDGTGCHVLDGHGQGGGEVAQLALTCLEADILPRFEITNEGPEIIRGLQNICGRFEKSGSTLSSVYIFGPKAYAFILGDSPVITIKGKKVTRIPIHDISNDEETKLRLAAGLYQDSHYPKHLFKDKNSGLSCFRSLGDSVFGDALGREPEMHELDDWDYIIVATDGLKLNDADILKNIKKGAQALIDANNEYLFGHSVDNTTVMTIRK